MSCGSEKTSRPTRCGRADWRGPWKICCASSPCSASTCSSFANGWKATSACMRRVRPCWASCAASRAASTWPGTACVRRCCLRRGPRPSGGWSSAARTGISWRARCRSTWRRFCATTCSAGWTRPLSRVPRSPPTVASTSCASGSA